MESLKSFKDKIHTTGPETFEHTALELFRYQSQNNGYYRRFIHEAGIDPEQVSGIGSIPFLPIRFFKQVPVKTGHWQEEEIFLSSGTTGMEVSRHYVEDMEFYHHISGRIFSMFYGDPAGYVILALLPSYLERRQSSLLAMVSMLIGLTGTEDSGFYLKNTDALVKKLSRLMKESNRKILLLGVTYALLDLAEKHDLDLKDVIIMETGGMKGRREELTRREVHEKLCNSFHVSAVHSEYGMTELMSQAYSEGQGIYRSPPWMRIYTREINDPFCIDNSLSHGVVNVVDLANVHSCAFIATDDLGTVKTDYSFEILGRMDNSDARGCNLLLN